MSSLSTETRFKLESEDKQVVEISRSALRHAPTLYSIAASHAFDPAAIGTIPVSDVDGDVLTMIVEWCEMHKKNKKMEPESRPFSLEMPKKDQKFVDSKSTAELFQVMNAASHLGIVGLIEVTSKKVAGMMRGRTPQELRDIFGIPAD